MCILLKFLTSFLSSGQKAMEGLESYPEEQCIKDCIDIFCVAGQHIAYQNTFNHIAYQNTFNTTLISSLSYFAR